MNINNYLTFIYRYIIDAIYMKIAQYYDKYKKIMKYYVKYI